MDIIEKLSFASDYMEGAHPGIMEKLLETNMDQSAGYGTDQYCQSARERIKKLCRCPDAEVEFLIGGTQANATVIDAMLRSYEGVIAANTGHVSLHEAGAIEHSGHKVIELPHTLGKMSPEEIEEYFTTFENDGNRDHMVQPKMVYISQPSEYGTLYSLKELTAISEICHMHNAYLYVDGARLAYALASPANDVAISDLARLCDAFYIGGTKCGALIGEAVVIPRPSLIPHFFTIIKQHGALLAKGRLLGIQFDELMRDDLYLHIGENAIRLARKIKACLLENGYQLFFESPTNQIFIVLDNALKSELDKYVETSFWEKYDDSHTVVRLATSWATKEENVEKLLEILKQMAIE